MANNTQPTPFLAAIKSPLVDKDGQLTWIGNKLFTDWNTRLENGLNLIGQFIGNISATAKIGSRPEGIGTTVNHLSAVGQLDSLTNVVSDVNLDHIANTATYERTTPVQVTGAATAYTALVSSTPSAGQFLKYGGASWAPTVPTFADITGTASSAQIPAPTPISLGGVMSVAPVAHQFINGIDGAGSVQTGQPTFGDIAGVASAGQVPALSALSGQITAGQLPASVPVVSFGVGAPVAASTEGYQYFDTTGSPYHGYVYHSGAWHIFS